ncbi:MAG: ATP-binding protein [Chloroflexota bacterium]
MAVNRARQLASRLAERWSPSRAVRRVTARLGFRAWLALCCGMPVLLVGLGAAELGARAYQARLVDDARQRTLGGLDEMAALVELERVRVSNAAEVAGVRLGPLIQGQEASPEELLRQIGQVRTALRASLIAVVDSGGRVVASDPASNLPFGNQFDARQAQQGRVSSSVQDRNPGIVLQAAAPVRVAGGATAGVALVVQNVDDQFLTNAMRISGLDYAVGQNGRVVAASRGARRTIAIAGDQTLEPELVGQPGDIFREGRIGSDRHLIAARAIQSGDRRDLATLLVTEPWEPISAGTWRVRTSGTAAAVSGALISSAVGALIGARLSGAARARATAIAALGSGPPAPMAGARSGAWSDLDASIKEADERLWAQLDERKTLADGLSAVMDSLSEGVIVADEARHVMLINSAARGLLSLPIGGEDGALAALVPADAAGGAVAGELAVSERVIRGYSAPVLAPDGRPLGSVTVLRDATREQEVDRLKSEFLATVSHELQTPLTAVKGALELVLDDETGSLSRVQRRFLDTINRNCERLIGLVGDLLDVSRLEAGKVQLEMRPLSMPALVRDLVATLTNVFESRGVRLDVRVADGLPPLLGDRRRVEQILTNLLSNAARHTPRGGRVTVEASAANGHVLLSVADSGPGIPSDDREHVFEKFYRGRDSRPGGEPGTGLGLAIAKSLADLHGGTISLEPSSEELPGAHFVVRLPRAEEE